MLHVFSINLVKVKKKFHLHTSHNNLPLGRREYILRHPHFKKKKLGYMELTSTVHGQVGAQVRWVLPPWEVARCSKDHG
jgi:hypothetical protein